MTDLTFNDPAEAAAWDMYVAAVISHPEMYEDSNAMSLADALLLERRKRMAPEKVEADDDLDGEGLATLDAAIEAGLKAINYGESKVTATKFLRAAIAKLIEGMEPPAWFSVEEDSGFDFALSEIRRRAGIEGEK
jgi:hypothetical protein